MLAAGAVFLWTHQSVLVDAVQIHQMFIMHS